SRLNPVWYGGAFVLGAASGILGDRWSLGFIGETERQVVKHLTGHLDSLPANDAKSRAIVHKMRDEEALHGTNARDAGASELPAPIRRMMRFTAKIMTGTAYWL
ncbi:MAG: demethoxyubiquinone hydroxylase family protein, partial [Woeseiaceae bacterium]